MNVLSARLSLVFSCIGHAYSHLFAPIFYVVALSLEKEWGMTHGEVVSLIVLGNVLFGVAAPLAGWLGDRWSSTGMIALFFLGTGTGMVLAGLADTPTMMMIWLALTGVFASIYHPVGIAWLVRHAEKRGTALGINGVFGGIGPGLAAVTAGLLIDLAGWRAAFVVPGLVLLATATVFVVLLKRGVIIETTQDRVPSPPASRQDTLRAAMVLAVTMLATGLIYQATQSAMPKAFSIGMADWLHDGALGVSAFVAIIYFVAGFLQVAAGWLADRYPLKLVYTLAFALQVPLLMGAAAFSGGSLFVAALLLVTVNVGALPAENSLLARYAPSKHRGLAFGLKYIMAFGLSGLGVWMEGLLFDRTGGFFILFMVLAAVAAVGTAANLLLPGERPSPAPAPAE